MYKWDAGHRDYVVLDLETTGLSRQKDAILEIAMIKVLDGVPVQTFQAFVNPHRPVPPFISRLTGIRDADVADASSFESVCGYVLDFIGDLPVLGWNVGFDVGFLEEKAGHSFSLGYMDVLPLARCAFPGLGSYRLSAVASYLGVRQGSHRALQDCVACMDIYEMIYRSAVAKKRQNV